MTTTRVIEGHLVVPKGAKFAIVASRLITSSSTALSTAQSMPS